jgi:5-methylcytosine-specific restriction endonuclease McrA
MHANPTAHTRGRGGESWVDDETRIRLILTLKRRDGERCCGCGRRFRRRSRPATIDHCRPRSRGGTDRIRNLRLLCLRCNQRKSNHLPGEPAWPADLLLPLPAVLLLPAAGGTS